MCRLFAFRSVITSQVHRSLVGADNALVHQSHEHPDGWGVAYYIAGSPHIIRSLTSAVECQLFEKVSGIASSQTVLAHLRRATAGGMSILNTHPFQYGRWTFAHNGNIHGFDALRPALLERLHPDLRRFVLGDTDSELIFFLVMSRLGVNGSDLAGKVSLEDLASAAGEAVAEICELAGPMHHRDDGPPDQTYLSFIITDGELLLAHQGGKDLYFSTYKLRCPERDSCVFFAPNCENPAEGGKANHLLFASEPLQGDNCWLPMAHREIIGIDGEMNLRRFQA
jgi:predicted glutamine amidotransferase